MSDGTRTGDDAARTSQRRVELAVVAVALVLGLHTLAWPLARDQGIEGTAGMLLLRGVLPYRDLWSHSPPGGFVSWALGFAVLGIKPVAIRAVDLAFIAGSAVGLARLAGRATTPRTGLLAGVVFLVSYYGHADFWHSAQRDTLMLLPSVWALVLARRPGTRACVGAGILVGVAALYKPGGAAMLVPACVLLGRDPRRWAICAASSAIPPLLFVVGLAITGSFAGFVEGVLDFNRGYAAHYAAGSGGRVGAASLAVLRLPFVERPELALAMLGLVAPVGARAWAGAWLLAGAASVYLQAALYPYHFVPLVPPLAVLVALAVAELPARVTGPARRRAAAVALAVLALATSLPALASWADEVGVAVAKTRGTLADGDYNARFAAAREYEVVAERVRAGTDPAEPLYVWGSDAQLFVLSRRAPADRHALNFALVAPWGARDGRLALVDRLRESPPPFVVIRRGDYMPWLSGAPGDSVATLRDFPELLRLFEADYRQVASTHYLLLLEHRAR